jgi:hypothetical protein
VEHSRYGHIEKSKPDPATKKLIKTVARDHDEALRLSVRTESQACSRVLSLRTASRLAPSR